MDYNQIKKKLEKIIEYEQKFNKCSTPSFGNASMTEYNTLRAELANVSYEDLKDYHSHAVLEMKTLEKRYENDIEKCELAKKLANNKIETVRKIINSDREIRINPD